MSVYRTLNRLPHSDVHHVTEHSAGPATRAGAVQDIPTQAVPEADWAKRRKASPAETLLPTTARWIARLPLGVRPVTMGATFPRIANVLAALWEQPDELVDYLSELLVDRRGNRSGFPIQVARELHALRAHYATLHPDRSDLWAQSKR
jgi:hypothetical protein